MTKRRNISISGHLKTPLEEKKKKEEERTERRRKKEEEDDVSAQCAPSAQLLRCGLAPSSQSHPDPHIAFIYLWKRVSRECVKEGRGPETGSG